MNLEIIQPNTTIGVLFGIGTSLGHLLFAAEAVTELTWETAIITMIIGGLGALGGFLMTGVVKWIRHKAVPALMSKIMNLFKRG